MRAFSQDPIRGLHAKDIHTCPVPVPDGIRVKCEPLTWGVAPLVKDDPDLAKIKPNARRNSLTIRLEQFEVDVNLKKEALALSLIAGARDCALRIDQALAH